MLAVASGQDGVALAQQVGADAVVDGHRDDVAAVARDFAPDGVDAALVTAGGAEVDKALAAIRDGGRVAYPNGVEPEPKAREGIHVRGYDGMPNPNVIEKINRLIGSGPFQVHIARTFQLDQAADAHRNLRAHHLGKLALRPGRPAGAKQVADNNAIRPFHVNVAEAELTELRRRINATKWPERETVTDASQGVQLATIQALALLGDKV